VFRGDEFRWLTTLQTFFITDSSKNDSSKPARACNACYDTVFPLLDPPTESEEEPTNPPPSDSTPYMNTIASLAGLPSWFAMPSFPLSSATPGPGALMALDRDREHGKKRGKELDRNDNDNDGNVKSNDSIDDYEIDADENDRDHGGEDEIRKEGSNAEIGPRGRVRMKVPVTRPRSSIEILGDFGRGTDPDSGIPSSSENMVPRSSARREDTARRSKRFSLPAVALQTTSVVARTSGGEGVGVGMNTGGAGKVKRFSLVLGGRVHAQAHGHGFGVSKSEVIGGGEGKGRSVAAGKLSELLGRRRA
jgi:FYVE/RhoGEF/PH domain-containing protein 5/6